MKIKLNLYILSLLSFGYILNYSSTLAMVKPQTEICENLSIKNLHAFKPFSDEPIKSIPKFVYENCNQYKLHNWSLDHWQRLKNAVGRVTKEKLKAKFPNEEEYITIAEGYDWIHGLNYLEENFLKKGKSIENMTLGDIIEINGKICRLTSDYAGQYRTQDILWNTREQTPTENIFFEIVNNYDLTKNNQIFGAIDHELSQILPNENSEVSIEKIVNLIKKLKERPIMTKNIVSGKFEIMDSSILSVDEVYNWYKEAPGQQKGFINLPRWVKSRCHIFTSPDLIKDEVSELLNFIKNSKIHPVEKAARIWYEIVRIHISREANKRTGKALASLVLLQHGYLPPVITVENEPEYKKVFIDAFKEPESEKGFYEFLRFVMKMVSLTQTRFKD